MDPSFPDMEEGLLDPKASQVHFAALVRASEGIFGLESRGVLASMRHTLRNPARHSSRHLHLGV
eukprot:4335533-Lingulodinium_polyedra.AAC.1